MKKKILAASLLCLAPVGLAMADVITFNEHTHGTIIDNQYVGSHSLSIDIDNPNRSKDVGVIFNSSHTKPTDKDFDTDLIGPPIHAWAGGNIPNTDLGNLLIIAENVRDKNNDNILDDPDDEGRRPAGSFNLTFLDPIIEFGFDLVDVEKSESNGYSSKFFKDGQILASIDFSDYIDPNSPYYDPSIGFGNNTANIIPTVTAKSLGVDDFDKVEIHMGGSGGITNLRFERGDEPPPPNLEIPLPSTFFSFIFGLSILGMVRRRFKKK